jgi:uncharacterized membrane protein YtjA (UPF0391 family)
MVYYALLFLLVAIISGVLGFSGMAPANTAWVLFVVGLCLAVVFFIRGKDGQGDRYRCTTCGHERKH